MGLLPAVLWWTGCMPWLAGESAETLAPGSWRVDGGVAVVSAVRQPADLLPVPQLRVAVGLGDGVDAAMTYAPPLTGHARVRARLHQGRGVAVAASAGWGVHGVPRVAGIESGFAVPFATASVQASTFGTRPIRGAVRVFVPYYAGDPAAYTAWVVPSVGVELGRGRVRWAPELGVVVPTWHPDRPQIVLGVALRTTRARRGRDAR